MNAHLLSAQNEDGIMCSKFNYHTDYTLASTPNIRVRNQNTMIKKTLIDKHINPHKCEHLAHKFDRQINCNMWDKLEHIANKVL